MSEGAETFRLLHITDLHLQSRPIPTTIINAADKVARLGKPSFDVQARNALKYWATANRNAFDACLVTGDLSHSGTNSDLSEALKFVLTSSTELGRPLIVLPGNHDRYLSASSRLPGGTEFERVFTDYWSAGRRIRAKGGLIRKKDSGQAILIVGVDFSLTDKSQATYPKGHWGQGFVDDAVLKELEEITLRAREKHAGVPVVWALHFSVISSFTLKLINSEKLVDTARSMGIPCVIAGHTHKFLVWGDGTRFITSSSATGNRHAWEFRRNNGFSLVEIKVVKGAVTEVDAKKYIFKEDNLEFVEAPKRD